MRATQTLTRDDRSRLDMAADWTVRLQAEELGEEQLAEWLAWYDNPANRLAFDEMQAVQEDVRAIDEKEKTAFASAFMRDRRGNQWASLIRNSQSVAWLRRWAPAKLWQGWRSGIAAAAVILLAIGVIAWSSDWFAPAGMSASYRTERGVHRVVNLVDGSVVRLGGGSSLSLNFTREVRYLVLESGEGFFEVAKDPNRPFIVQAGAVRVRAVGTEFNVRRSAGNTFVAVKEGAVEVVQEGGSTEVIASSAGRSKAAGASATAAPDGVEAIRLRAGEQAAATYSARALTVASISPVAVASWQQGRLEFVDEPLQSVIATVNRYSKRDIVLTDPATVGDMRFTGIVMEGRIEDWVNAIQEVFPLKATTAGKGAILISPAKP